ncbi:carboxymuconolactone decarboxylase family protein [Ferrovibrio sp.]|uniref:carboxymuconolactone decarboxylase family protein n=1 Tax=Ferrovibrio sp. TaxID=1917215 RepID=UPI003D0A71AB
MHPRIAFSEVPADHRSPLMALHKTLDASSLGKTLVELVYLRVSQINGCTYCIDMHTTALLKAGLDNRKLATLMHWRETAWFDAREAAALAWAEALTRCADGWPDPALYAELERQFSRAEIIDLVYAIGLMNALNRTAIAFGQGPA